MSTESLNIMLFLVLMINEISNVIPLSQSIPEENVCKKKFQFKHNFEYPI